MLTCSTELICTIARDGQEKDDPRAPLRHCRCPAPARLIARAHTLLDILHTCEEQIRRTTDDPRWQLGPLPQKSPCAPWHCPTNYTPPSATTGIPEHSLTSHLARNTADGTRSGVTSRL